MLDKNKTYSFKELTDLYNMLNIEFKYFGQNDKGDLILYMLDNDKILTFISNNNGNGKIDYLNYNDEDIDNLSFKFYKEVEMQDYDINIIVNTSPNEKIPSGRYSIETIDKLTIENDDFKIDNPIENQVNGIAYIVVEKNSNTPLFSGIYKFGNNGLLNDIENNLLPQYEKENNKIAVNNIKDFFKLYKSNNLEMEMIN